MAGAKIVIRVMSGPDDGQRIYLSQDDGDGDTAVDGTWSVVIGRKEKCDVSIPFDTQVSREHAVLRLTPEHEFWLMDAGSMNGTFIERQRVLQPTLVERGQLFRLGGTWLRIEPEAGDK